MTKAFISGVLQRSCDLSVAKSKSATNELIDEIIAQMKREGSFTLSGFGTFTVVQKKARIGINPRTQERVKVKAGKAIRFKASQILKKAIAAPATKRRGSAPAGARRHSGRTGASA